MQYMALQMSEGTLAGVRPCSGLKAGAVGVARTRGARHIGER